VRIVWDERNRLWGGGSHLAGGAPWGLLRLAPRARPVVQRLRAAGSAGIDPATPLEHAVARWLLGRGLAHPHPTPPREGLGTDDDVVVVIPAFGRPELLDACLASLGATPALVVDDASPDAEAIRAVSDAHGASYVRHPVNRGPGAARNTGLEHTDARVIAFLDSDCTASADWLGRLVRHLDDDRVGLVAPRVRPRPAGDTLLARYEQARSALDMGAQPELVTHGARLGFLPSAALVVRRAAIPTGGFDASMRVGEDVDLLWRIVDAGWLARYDPEVVVHHEMRLEPSQWARRRATYGTSAAALERRHPGRLTPARPSVWNVAIAVSVLARRPALAGVIGVASVVDLAAGLDGRARGGELATRVAAKGLLADTTGVGHALRREWWPIGWLGLSRVGRSRWGTLVALAMLVPLAVEYRRHRPDLDPVRYLGLRLAEDAAYGSGVLVGAVRQRCPGVIVARLRPPASARWRPWPTRWPAARSIRHPDPASRNCWRTR
jgi:mycofactocin glycosyltransferase